MSPESTLSHSPCIALIFAGGVGSRMNGAKVPKQFLELGGRPIIAHTIDQFEQHSEVDSIVVVCVESGIPHLRDVVETNRYQKVHSIVSGGQTGQDSIFNGLLEIERLELADDASVVLVHDGVRPLIDADTISSCIASVRTRGCTATVAPAFETIIEVQGEKVERLLDRSSCMLARAPQGMPFGNLIAAHRKMRAEDSGPFVDSISLMGYYGYPIFTVEGPADNIKITTRKDFFAFKGYMDYKEMNQLLS